MAVKYAVANGNWSAGATWNGGVVPADGDEVYCNGYTITCSQNFTFNGVIHNDSNEDLSINQGGYLAMSGTAGDANWVIRKIISVAMIIRYQFSGSGRLFTLTATIEHSGVEGAIWSNSQKTINGDVTLGTNSLLWSYPINAQYNNNIINGNVYAGSGSFIIKWGITENYFIQSCVINGNCAAGVTSKRVLINGNYTPKNSYVNCDEFTLSGNIAYENCGNGGVATGTFNILNPDTFIWKDVTEPRSNPFIIVTDAEMNNRQQYPPENEVKEGTEYVWGEMVGTYTPDYPPESVVLKDYEYGDSDDRKTGTMEQEVNVEVGCVTPEDVRKDVPLVGMGVTGTLVVPSVDDVREGVVFDNGSVGTLIVQGGGDRLRIADFGYYTNAQSDTYIVDLTEQDKPKFAVAEERVLIEMFPDLDLENIPDKYFDDLFVKYLKYRLIVEYYRTAGINSTFTPSEPTTEIVNYQNVRNEVWLNSANIYLKAWAKKYPESITKPQRILL